RKEALEATIRKKIELEKKAVRIVEQLMESDVTEDYLMECKKILSKSHFFAITQFLLFLQIDLSYPIIKRKFGIIPKQKYKISTKTNKVYDITERKCFCSNVCYKASKYFDAQILKTPLWLREEQQSLNLKLLKEGQSGKSGEEIQMCDEPIKMSEIENPRFLRNQSASAFSDSDNSSSDPEQEFVSTILSGGNNNIGKLEQQEQKRTIRTRRSIKTLQLKDKVCDNEVLKKLSDDKLNCSENQNIASQSSQKSRSLATQPNPVQVDISTMESDVTISDVTSRGVSKKGAEEIKKLLVKSKQYLKNAMLESLKQTLTEWKTEETLKFLYGSNYKSKPSQTNLLSAFNSEQELDEDDLADCLEDSSERCDESSQNSLNQSLPFQGSETAIKPLPDYDDLKQDTAALYLQVGEFYKGQYVLPEGSLQSTANVNACQEDSVLPLVDSNAQHQIRKRIVMSKLKKVLPEILDALQLPMCNISPELINLVKTLRLTNKNIIHKTPEWSLIAVVFLSLCLVIKLTIRTQKVTLVECLCINFLSTSRGAKSHTSNRVLSSVIALFNTTC
uniref:RNA polymerase II subunit B1 CTD phosphatase RPAP2 homolog n=1 Tax=Latimeria chalumnae TaxID=7897 RepID=H3B1F0_LATCH